MNAFSEVLPNLPPGLWLPTSEEPTEQYHTENFYTFDKTLEDYVDYGSFMVALMFFSEDESRVSFMPTKGDVQELYEQGYGSPFVRYTKLGGLGLVQQGLGFYSRGFEPDPDQLVDRLKWLIAYGYPIANPRTDMGEIGLREIIDWGSSRDLVTNYHRVLDMFDGSLVCLRKELGVERRHNVGSLTNLDMMRFLQKVITENNGPITLEKMDAKYKDYFISTPSMVLRWMNGRKPLSSLWEEFGYVRDASRLKPEDHIRIGVRTQLLDPTISLDHQSVTQLSRRDKHTSTKTIQRHFGTIEHYQAEVHKALIRYRQFEQTLRELGVSDDTLIAITGHYRTGDDYEEYLRSNVGELSAVSKPSAQYVRSLMKTGFNLTDEDIFDIQMVDCISAMYKSGLMTPSGINCIFTLIPRISPQDALLFQQKMKVISKC